MSLLLLLLQQMTLGYGIVVVGGSGTGDVRGIAYADIAVVNAEPRGVSVEPKAVNVEPRAVGSRFT